MHDLRLAAVEVVRRPRHPVETAHRHNGVRRDEHARRVALADPRIAQIAVKGTMTLRAFFSTRTGTIIRTHIKARLRYHYGRRSDSVLRIVRGIERHIDIEANVLDGVLGRELFGIYEATHVQPGGRARIIAVPRSIRR